jgi:polyisoprenoid-binding protein YceI
MDGKMAARLTGFVLYAYAGLLFATPAAAQGTVWRIDATQSTARLYITAANRRDARINVGVARLSGNVLQGEDFVLPATVAFQIYPADSNSKLRKPDGSLPSSQTQMRANSTTIAFRSRTVQLLDQKSVLVRGDLTATYVSRNAEYDPSKGYSGPVYGPPVIHSVKREVGFVFRVAPPAGKRDAKRGIVEWSASSVIAGDLFPELWNAVVTTDWPAFLVNEQCNAPADTGEDFSVPACTGKLVEPVPPTDAHCDMPSSVGEDFSGATCDGAPLPVVPKKEKHSRVKGGQPKQGSGGAMANVVEIELVLRLARVSPAPQSRPPSTNDPTARNVEDRSRHSGPA